MQGAIPQDEKWLSENLTKTLELYATMSREAYGTDLVVWPESAAPALFNDLVEFYHEVYQEASGHGSALLIGALRAEENAKTSEAEYYNAVLAIDPSTRDRAGTTSSISFRSRNSFPCRSPCVTGCGS